MEVHVYANLASSTIQVIEFAGTFCSVNFAMERHRSCIFRRFNNDEFEGICSKRL